MTLIPGYARAVLTSLTIAFVVVVGSSTAAAQFSPRTFNQPETAEDYHIEGGIDLWLPTADVTISSTSLGIAGTDIDFKSDLGLVDQKMPAFHAQFKAGRNKLRFQFVPIGYTQSAALRRDIIFNGQRYRAGLTVNSTVDWKAYRFGYEFDIVKRSRGFLGVIAEVKYTDVGATLTALVPGTAITINEFDHARAPIPAIGGVGRVYIVPNFSVTADITGFTLPGNTIKDATGHFFDLDISGTFNFNNNVGIRGGYRAFDVNYGFRTDSGSFTLKGLYFGGVVRY
jgi:hypothetical protein